MDNEIVSLLIISLRKKIKKPIKIEINKILKKFSFLLNLPEIPITTKDNITIKKGFKISDV